MQDKEKKQKVEGLNPSRLMSALRIEPEKEITGRHC